jgi:hypothetical protein
MVKKKARKPMKKKPSELEKPDKISLRINPRVRAKLSEEGLSLQEIFDNALDSLISIEVAETITVDKKKSIKKN